MPVGFQSFVNNSNIVQIDSDRFTYVLKQKGTFTGTSVTGPFGGGYTQGNITITGCNSPIVFVPPGQLLVYATNNGGGSYTFGLANPFGPELDYACFDIGNYPSTPNIGLKLYNSLGQLTFDSNLLPLLIVGTGVEGPFGTGTGTPITVPTNKSYWYTGGGAWSSIGTGSEILPGEYELQDYWSVMTQAGDTLDFSQVLISVGTTNIAEPFSEGGPSAYWMVADMSYLVDVITLSPRTVVSTSSASSAVTSSIQFGNNGKTTTITVSGSSGVENWVEPASAAPLYEIRATLVSGTSPTGAVLNTWLPLSTTRIWTVTRLLGTGAGTTTGTINVQIRRASDLYVLGNANITLQATRTTPL